MSLRKWRKPSLLDKHLAEEAAEKELGMVEKSTDKARKIIKKVSRKN